MKSTYKAAERRVEVIEVGSGGSSATNVPPPAKIALARAQLDRSDLVEGSTGYRPPIASMITSARCLKSLYACRTAP